jgi:hypothetical protein
MKKCFPNEINKTKEREKTHKKESVNREAAYMVER